MLKVLSAIFENTNLQKMLIGKKSDVEATISTNSSSWNANLNSLIVS